MATCFSYNSQTGDAVLHIRHFRPIIIKLPLSIKRPISEVATPSRRSVCAVMPAPTSITGSDEPSHWPTDGVVIVSSLQEFLDKLPEHMFGEGMLITSSSSSNLQGHNTFGNSRIYEAVDIERLPESWGLGMSGKTKIYSDVAPIIDIGWPYDEVPESLGLGMKGKTKLAKPPIIIGWPYEVPESLGIGIKGKTKMYSDAAPVKVSSKLTVNEILQSSFGYDGDAILTTEMAARLTEWGKPTIVADPMVGPNLQQMFAGVSSSTNQGSGISEAGVSSTINATPDRHCIDIPAAAAAQGRNMISGPDHAARGRRAALMTCVCEQAVAGVVANQITAAGDSNALALYFMVLAIMFGLTFKLAAVALQGNTRRQTLSTWMGKIGDMLTASAIILSLTMHLPPLMACIAAPLAFLIIALAVTFA